MIMSDEDWSCIEEWTVATSDEWSLLTSNEDYESLNSVEAVTLPITAANSPFTTIPSPSMPFEDEASCETYFEPFSNRARGGKRAQKHSLVRRTEFDKHYGSDYPINHGNAFMEVCRRPCDEAGQRVKTVVDDVLPELLMEQTVTLGKAKRWNTVQKLLNRLEEEGTATSTARVKLFSGWVQRFGRYSYLPHNVVHYIVKPNGTNTGMPMFYIKNPPRTNVEDGVEYILHHTSDGDASFQRKYSFKSGRSYTKDDRWLRRRKNNKARKRAEIKASIKDALK